MQTPTDQGTTLCGARIARPRTPIATAPGDRLPGPAGRAAQAKLQDRMSEETTS